MAYVLKHVNTVTHPYSDKPTVAKAEMYSEDRDLLLGSLKAAAKDIRAFLNATPEELSEPVQQVFNLDSLQLSTGIERDEENDSEYTISGSYSMNGIDFHAEYHAIIEEFYGELPEDDVAMTLDF